MSKGLLILRMSGFLDPPLVAEGLILFDKRLKGLKPYSFFLAFCCSSSQSLGNPLLEKAIRENLSLFQGSTTCFLLRSNIAN